MSKVYKLHNSMNTNAIFFAFYVFNYCTILMYDFIYFDVF